MASEYIIAGRRALPPGNGETWSWSFALEDTYSEDEDADEDEDFAAAMFDDGSFELDEIRRDGNDEFYAFVERHAGFSPTSVVTIRKAGWDFSRAAAEVLAAALDGVHFVDTSVDEYGLEPAVAPSPPATSLEELQMRIEAASREPATFFERWAAADARAQEEADRRDPAAAALRASENDWSDV